MQNNFLVAVVVGSDSDLPVMQDCFDLLDELKITYDVSILSAHRTPKQTAEYVEKLNDANVKAIIAAAGGAAHLPGVIAAYANCPVIGVPMHTKTLSGIDSLYSIVQMPTGIPVATVAINGAKNAAILALQILGTSDDKIKQKVKEYKKKLEENVLEKNTTLKEMGVKEYLKNKKN